MGGQLLRHTDFDDSLVPPTSQTCLPECLTILLGNGDLTFGVIAVATAGTFCHNKGNPANIVPGQNPAVSQFADFTTIPGSSIKNGTVDLPAISFSFSLATPTTEQAGCPNDNWSVTLGEVTWEGQYVVYQPFPTLVSCLSFSF